RRAGGAARGRVAALLADRGLVAAACAIRGAARLRRAGHRERRYPAQQPATHHRYPLHRGVLPRRGDWWHACAMVRVAAASACLLMLGACRCPNPSPVLDAGADGSVIEEDSGVDASVDSGVDAGFDSGVDAGVD